LLLYCYYLLSNFFDKFLFIFLDNKFHKQPSRSWTPRNEAVPAYQHHDIIGHRVVDMSDNKPFNERIGRADKKAEIREQMRVNKLKSSHERRLVREGERKNKLQREKNERDEQAR